MRDPLRSWLNHYNFSRPHGALSHKPPAHDWTNVPRNNSRPGVQQSPALAPSVPLVAQSFERHQNGRSTFSSGQGFVPS